MEGQGRASRFRKAAHSRVEGKYICRSQWQKCFRCERDCKPDAHPRRRSDFKGIVCLNDGKYIPERSAASRAYNLTLGTVNRVCKDKQTSVGGLVFRYFGEHEGGPEEAARVVAEARLSQRRGLGPNYKKKVIRTSDNMMYDTVREAALNNKISGEIVIKSCKGRYRYNMKWKDAFCRSSTNGARTLYEFYHMRPHPRRARTNPTSPRAWATDDKSGFVGNQESLRWQYEWQGTRLTNKRILCFDDTYDQPNRQLGTIILPPDPISITKRETGNLIR